jgi:hypothetical protein
VPLSVFFPIHSAPIVDQHTECAWSLQQQILNPEREGEAAHIVANDISVFSSSDMPVVSRYQFEITL